MAAIGRLMGVAAVAMSLTAERPLRSDREMNYKIEYDTFETNLPLDPKDIR